MCVAGRGPAVCAPRAFVGAQLPAVRGRGLVASGNRKRLHGIAIQGATGRARGGCAPSMRTGASPNVNSWKKMRLMMPGGRYCSMTGSTNSLTILQMPRS